MQSCLQALGRVRELGWATRRGEGDVAGDGDCQRGRGGSRRFNQEGIELLFANREVDKKGGAIISANTARAVV